MIYPGAHDEIIYRPSRRSFWIFLLIVVLVVTIGGIAITGALQNDKTTTTTKTVTNIDACRQETILARKIMNDLGIEATNPGTADAALADQDLTGLKDQFDNYASQCLSTS